MLCVHVAQSFSVLVSHVKYPVLCACSLSVYSNSFSLTENYNINTDMVSLSGFSSGGYMAVQFHVAFSKLLMGVGILAGGMQ